MDTGGESNAQSTPLVAREDIPLVEKNQRVSHVPSWWALIGPGILCCLADTDAGCLIVAAESGARWEYSLLLLQIVLIPILFWAQNLTITLAVHTNKGHTACIKEHFGSRWAWFATILLVVECVAAMVSEISGISAVAALWGLSDALAVFVAVLVVFLIVTFLNYRQIEVLGVGLGLFELTFVATMFMYHPSLFDVARGSVKFHTDREYLRLIASNMGAVIMPWMIYFQQSAIVARGLKPGAEARAESVATFLGSCLTQLVMIGTLVTLAAAQTGAVSLTSVKEIVEALAPKLGTDVAKVLVSLAFLGGSGCAAFVVSLAASWAICEAAGVPQDVVATSLDARPTEAPFFYLSFACVAVFGPMVIIFGGMNVVKLNVLIEMLDGVLLPFALGFLFLLATSDALPPEARLQGKWKWFLGTVFMCCVLLSLTSATIGLIPEALR